jgi:hypothetical protein
MDWAGNVTVFAGQCHDSGPQSASDPVPAARDEVVLAAFGEAVALLAEVAKFGTAPPARSGSAPPPHQRDGTRRAHRQKAHIVTATDSPGRPMIELECGITVYPARFDGDLKRHGADLITHYLDPDRLPVDRRWSRKHADTQRRLCERFAAPVIEDVTCQDIKTSHTQRIVNAAPTAGEGTRARRMITALVAAGIEGGYLAKPTAGQRALAGG